MSRKSFVSLAGEAAAYTEHRRKQPAKKLKRSYGKNKGSRLRLTPFCLLTRRRIEVPARDQFCLKNINAIRFRYFGRHRLAHCKLSAWWSSSPSSRSMPFYLASRVLCLVGGGNYDLRDSSGMGSETLRRFLLQKQGTTSAAAQTSQVMR